MKKSILFSVAVMIAFAVNAQSPVGKWKLSGVHTETFSGKKTDMTKDFVDGDPCFSNAVLNFTADGKIDVQAKGCKMDEAADKFVIWKTVGKTIKFYAGKDDNEPEVFELEVSGNKMRWIKRFEYENDMDRSVGIKLVVEEFTKQ